LERDTTYYWVIRFYYDNLKVSETATLTFNTTKLSCAESKCNKEHSTCLIHGNSYISCECERGYYGKHCNDAIFKKSSASSKKSKLYVTGVICLVMIFIGVSAVIVAKIIQSRKSRYAQMDDAENKTEEDRDGGTIFLLSLCR